MTDFEVCSTIARDPAINCCKLSRFALLLNAVESITQLVVPQNSMVVAALVVRLIVSSRPFVLLICGAAERRSV